MLKVKSDIGIALPLIMPYIQEMAWEINAISCI